MVKSNTNSIRISYSKIDCSHPIYNVYRTTVRLCLRISCKTIAIYSLLIYIVYYNLDTG